MKVQAEVSLYPLRTTMLTESIDRFLDHVRRDGVSVETGAMSSRISGECRDLLNALSGAFEEACRHDDVVLTIKVSNACPLAPDDGPAHQTKAPD